MSLSGRVAEVEGNELHMKLEGQKGERTGLCKVARVQSVSTGDCEKSAMASDRELDL